MLLSAGAEAVWEGVSGCPEEIFKDINSVARGGREVSLEKPTSFGPS